MNIFNNLAYIFFLEKTVDQLVHRTSLKKKLMKTSHTNIIMEEKFLPNQKTQMNSQVPKCKRTSRNKTSEQWQHSPKKNQHILHLGRENASKQKSRYRAGVADKRLKLESCLLHWKSSDKLSEVSPTENWPSVFFRLFFPLPKWDYSNKK